MFRFDEAEPLNSNDFFSKSMGANIVYLIRNLRETKNFIAAKFHFFAQLALI